MKKKLIVLFLLLTVASVSVFYFLTRQDNNALTVSGQMEQKEANVGSKIGGRIKEILVREGESVKAGALLIKLEDDEATQKLLVAEAQLLATKQTLAKLKSGYKVEEIAQAKAAYEAAKGELEAARADELNAKNFYARMQKVYAEQLISKQELENAQNQADKLGSKLESAKKKADEASAKYEYYKNGSRVEDIRAAEQNVKNLEAAAELAKINLKECQVTAPFDATVETIGYEAGDIVAPNAGIVKLLNPKELYLRIYIPETELAYAVAQKTVSAVFEAYPNRVFEGIVEQVAKEAEFAPKNMSTKEDRQNQVFAAKVRLKDDGKLKSGMVAETTLKR